jgi:hypothetical protein
MELAINRLVSSSSIQSFSRRRFASGHFERPITEQVMNAETARILGLTVPPPLLGGEPRIRPPQRVAVVSTLIVAVRTTDAAGIAKREGCSIRKIKPG